MVPRSKSCHLWWVLNLTLLWSCIDHYENKFHQHEHNCWKYMCTGRPRQCAHHPYYHLSWVSDFFHECNSQKSSMSPGGPQYQINQAFSTWYMDAFGWDAWPPNQTRNQVIFLGHDDFNLIWLCYIPSFTLGWDTPLHQLITPFQAARSPRSGLPTFVRRLKGSWKRSTRSFWSKGMPFRERWMRTVFLDSRFAFNIVRLLTDLVPTLIILKLVLPHESWRFTEVIHLFKHMAWSIPCSKPRLMEWLLKSIVPRNLKLRGRISWWGQTSSDPFWTRSSDQDS